MGGGNIYLVASISFVENICEEGGDGHTED